MRNKKIYNIIRLTIFFIVLIGLIVFELVLNANFQSFKAIYEANKDVGAYNAMKITQYTMVIFALLMMSTLYLVVDLVNQIMVYGKEKRKFNLFMLMIQLVGSMIINILLFCMIGNLSFMVIGYILSAIWAVCLIIQDIFVKKKNNVYTNPNNTIKQK